MDNKLLPICYYGYIYKTINLINNKVYIGQHKSNSFDKCYFGSGKILLRAIKKYSLKSFKVEPIIFLHNRDELNLFEKLYINIYRGNDRNYGYNILRGGQGSMFIHGRGMKGLLGKNNPNYGSKRTPEQRKNMSLVHIELGIKNGGTLLGRKAIHKDNVIKYVKKEELNFYLNHDWNSGTGRIGTIPGSNNSKRIKQRDNYYAKSLLYNIERDNKHKTTLGCTPVNKNGVNRYIFKQELYDYLLNGWRLGLITYKDKYCLNELFNVLKYDFNKFCYVKDLVLGKKQEDTIFVHRNDYYLCIPKSIVSIYEKIGFIKGGKPKSYSHKQKIARGNAGKITFTNGKINIRCNSEETDYYLSKGFWRGLTRRN